MASYKLEIRRSAQKEIRQLPAKTRIAVVAAISGLAANPRPAGVTKLQGYSGMYRLRHSDYRIVYEILDKKLIITVVKVGHRSRVYKG